MTEPTRNKAQKIIRDMVQDGETEPSNSPWASPVVERVIVRSIYSKLFMKILKSEDGDLYMYCDIYIEVFDSNGSYFALELCLNY